MITPKLLLRATAGILGTLCLQASPPQEKTPDAQDEGPARVVPVIRLDAKGPATVECVFENASTDVIHYLEGQHPRTVASFSISLFDGDMRIPSRLPLPTPPVLAKSRVRPLKPGESLLYTVDLRAWYGDLKPGRYELRAEYNIPEGSVPHTEYGITPMEVDQKVAYLDIR